jgi:hypothetical protein
MRIKHNPRAYDNGSFYTVSYSAADADAFRRQWPGSTVRGKGWFEFDKKNGDLIGGGGSMMEHDGSDWLAFSQDMQAHGRRSMGRRGQKVDNSGGSTITQQQLRMRNNGDSIKPGHFVRPTVAVMRRMGMYVERDGVVIARREGHPDDYVFVVWNDDSTGKVPVTAVEHVPAHKIKGYPIDEHGHGYVSEGLVKAYQKKYAKRMALEHFEVPKAGRGRGRKSSNPLSGRYPVASDSWHHIPKSLRKTGWSYHVRAVPTGEMRAPRKGEWFLSGAVVEAYYAPNDLSTPYHIAKLTWVDQPQRGANQGRRSSNPIKHLLK